MNRNFVQENLTPSPSRRKLRSGRKIDTTKDDNSQILPETIQNTYPSVLTETLSSSTTSNSSVNSSSISIDNLGKNSTNTNKSNKTIEEFLNSIQLSELVPLFNKHKINLRNLVNKIEFIIEI